jgi:hypothetical protein
MNETQEGSHEQNKVRYIGLSEKITQRMKVNKHMR